MNPDATQLKNRTLGAGLTDTQTAGVSGGTGYTAPTNTSDGSSRSLGNTGADTLSNYLSSNPLDQTNKTIMDSYSEAKKASQSATDSMGQSITDEFAPQLEYTKQQNVNSQTSAQEAQRGFAQNTAALTQLQNTADKRIRDLTTQRDQMLLANNSEGAKRLSDLVVQEQSTLTQARQSWVQNLLGLSSAQNAATQTGIAQSAETRAQAGFETPEQTRQRNLAVTTQQSVNTLSGQYPDAGINSTDDLATATQKIQANSKIYKQNISKGQADIQAAIASAQASGAQAGLSSAEAARTRTLTGLISPNSADTQNDVQGLINGTIYPEDIMAKYANATNGGDIAKSIISQAQAKGYDLSKGNLAGKAKQNLNQSASSGNPLSAFTAGVQSLFAPPKKSLSPSTGNADYQAYLKAVGLQ